MARKRFEFWLNDQRHEDWQVYELIGKLKKPARGQGQFTRAIREGLRLWVSLRDGQTDVLLELFPWVGDAIRKTTTPVAGGGGQSELAKEIAAQIILQGGTPGYLMQSTALRAEDLITAADIEFLERQKKAPPMKAATAPPKATAAVAAVSVSSDEIASNFLSMFD